MFSLDQVVPWGRSFAEYSKLFALESRDMEGAILGCGDGPAAFNAEAARRGTRVISCDPLYAFGAAEIRARIDATRADILEQTRKHRDEFVWTSIRSIEELGETRMAAMETFLADYEAGKAAGRYVTAELPALPFDDGQFDLALCSHLLFLYSLQLGEEFHRESLVELCRVAREVRIFPLLSLGGQRSPYVDDNIASLREAGYAVSVETVAYEFQRGGNQMLRIKQS